MKRSGFTLIEMLVVISILLIITLMTIGVVNFSMNSERIGSAARQMQSYVEGAKSRAIYSKEPRGIRYYLDPIEDPDGRRRMVRSMVYIGPSGFWDAGKINLARETDDGVNVQLQQVNTVISMDNQTDWKSLVDKKLIRNGETRIRIPAGQLGTWYTIQRVFETPNGREMIRLVTPYSTAATSDPSRVLAFSSGLPATYEIALPYVVLPNQEPVILPKGIAVDLDYSELPGQWYTPTLKGRVYDDTMDVMFSPRGYVINSVASAGLIHFFLCPVEDIDFSRRKRDRATDAFIFSFDETSPEGAVGDMLISTLQTSTGNAMTNPVDVRDEFTNGTTNQIPDGLIDDPFRFAETGGE